MLKKKLLTMINQISALKVPKTVYYQVTVKFRQIN